MRHLDACRLDCRDDRVVRRTVPEDRYNPRVMHSLRPPMPTRPLSERLSLVPEPCPVSDGEALALALLLQHEPSHQRRQIELVRAALGEAVAARVADEAARVLTSARAQRLPLLETATAALRGLDAAAARRLVTTAEDVIRADGRVSLTEYVFARILRDAVLPRATQRRAAASPAELRRHCTLLLSAVARAGTHRDEAVAAAFACGVSMAPLDGLGDLLPATALRGVAVDAALDTLATTSPAFRDKLMQALGAVAWHDGHITAAERELLHAIGSALGVASGTASGTGSAAAPGVAPNVAAGEAQPDAPALLLATADGARDEVGAWSERDRLPVQALVVANLVPLAGVLLFGWDARNLLLLYWLENLVVGGYTLLRMLHAGGLHALFPAAFFTFHYSFFCAGHGIFIMAIAALGAGDTDGPDVFPDDSWGPLMPFAMLWQLFAWIAEHAPGMLALPLFAFVVSHGISTVVHHFIGGEDAGRKADDIMFDPYKRIVALHIAILAGSFVVIGSGGGSLAPALAVLVGIKTAIDLHQHRHAHRRRAERAAENRGQDEDFPSVQP